MKLTRSPLITAEVIAATASTFSDRQRKQALKNLDALALNNPRLKELRDAFEHSQEGRVLFAIAGFKSLADKATEENHLGDQIHFSVKMLCSMAPIIARDGVFSARFMLWDNLNKVLGTHLLFKGNRLNKIEILEQYQHKSFNNLVALALGKDNFKNDEEMWQVLVKVERDDLKEGILPTTFAHVVLGSLNPYFRTKVNPTQVSALENVQKKFGKDFPRGDLLLAKLLNEIGKKEAANTILSGLQNDKHKNNLDLQAVVRNMLEDNVHPIEGYLDNLGHPVYMNISAQVTHEVKKQHRR